MLPVLLGALEATLFQPLTPSESARRQVTVFSCRLVGSALAANLDPKDFAGTVHRFQDICSSVITQWDGAVTHMLAGEILALFGYPKSHEDDAERAVHAGLDLIPKIGELLSPAGKPVQARIAIATSLVFVGENQTATGEAIVTARLLNATAPNSVSVSSSTRKLLGSSPAMMPSYANFKEFPSGSQLTESPASEQLGAASMPREVESRHGLSGGSMNCGRCRPYGSRPRVPKVKFQVVLVCGEAGIGKSRVCSAWLDSIAEEPHITLPTYCSRYHTNNPFYPVIKQIEHVARFEREDSPEVKLKKLETALSQAGANTL